MAVLGASSYTYAEATAEPAARTTWSAPTRGWPEYFGGSTEIWVPDQLKSAVTRPCRYEPGINRTYQELAAPLRRGGDPGPAGQAPGQGQGRDRWCWSPSAGSWPACATRPSSRSSELNAAIARLLEELNEPPDAEDRQEPARAVRAARPPRAQGSSHPVATSWPSGSACRVNIDYHVEVDHHPYSVPYQLVGREAWRRATPARSSRSTTRAGGSPPTVRRYDHQPSTLAEHMPSSHRAHAEWTPSRLIRWAEKTGPGHRPRGDGHPARAGRTPSRATAPAWG